MNVEQRSKQKIVIQTNMARLKQYPWRAKNDYGFAHVVAPSHHISEGDAGPAVLGDGVVDNQEIESYDKDTDNVTENNLAMHVVKVRNDDVDEKCDNEEYLTNDSKTCE